VLRSQSSKQHLLVARPQPCVHGASEPPFALSYAFKQILQADINATSYSWQQAPATAHTRQRPRVSLANALLGTVALLAVYCIYEQLSFWLNRCCKLVALRVRVTMALWPFVSAIYQCLRWHGQTFT
jgi:hypothetical protein